MCILYTFFIFIFYQTHNCLLCFIHSSIYIYIYICIWTFYTFFSPLSFHLYKVFRCWHNSSVEYHIQTPHVVIKDKRLNRVNAEEEDEKKENLFPYIHGWIDFGATLKQKLELILADTIPNKTKILKKIISYCLLVYSFRLFLQI